MLTCTFRDSPVPTIGTLLAALGRRNVYECSNIRYPQHCTKDGAGHHDSHHANMSSMAAANAEGAESGLDMHVYAWIIVSLLLMIDPAKLTPC